MTDPDYIAPATLEEALDILADTTRTTCILAGGTNLIPRLRLREIEPDLLVDIRQLRMNGIHFQENTLHLGAGVTCSQVSDDQTVRSNYPALAQACEQFASPAIRGRSTVGGNLAAAFPEANLIPALLIYDSQWVIARQGMIHAAPLIDFYSERSPFTLKPGDLITEIRVPLPPPRSASNYMKFGNRRGMVTAIVNVAVRLSLDENLLINQARLALGSYAQVPILATQAGNALIGYGLDAAPFEEISQAIVESYPARFDPFVGTNYRKKLARVLIERALQSVSSDLKRMELHG